MSYSEKREKKNSSALYEETKWAKRNSNIFTDSKKKEIIRTDV